MNHNPIYEKAWSEFLERRGRRILRWHQGGANGNFTYGLQYPTNFEFSKLLSDFCSEKSIPFALIDCSTISSYNSALEALHALPPKSVVVIDKIADLPEMEYRQVTFNLLFKCWKNADYSIYDPKLPDLRGHYVFLAQTTLTDVWNPNAGYGWIGNIVTVSAAINVFLDNRSVDERYASYDFCYLYFQTNRGSLGGANMETSCMHLWSYLASWGMLRGSSALLKCSPSILKDLIAYFDDIKDSIVWTIDVDTYTRESKEEILKVYHDIDERIQKSIARTLGKETNDVNVSVTLITKIMLGIFGCVPAIDQYFYSSFHKRYKGFGKLGTKELNCLKKFYDEYKYELDSFQISVLDFSGNNTNLLYKKAKLIDMYGFSDGLHNSQKNK